MKNNRKKQQEAANIYKFLFYAGVAYCLLTPLFLILIYSAYGPPLLDSFAGGRSRATQSQIEAGSFILHVLSPLVMLVGLTSVLVGFYRIVHKNNVSRLALMGLSSLLVIAIFISLTVIAWPYIT